MQKDNKLVPEIQAKEIFGNNYTNRHSNPSSSWHCRNEELYRDMPRGQAAEQAMSIILLYLKTITEQTTISSEVNGESS